MKAKEKEKLQAEIEYAAARLGRYTQPIAYLVSYVPRVTERYLAKDRLKKYSGVVLLIFTHVEQISIRRERAAAERQGRKIRTFKV